MSEAMAYVYKALKPVTVKTGPVQTRYDTGDLVVVRIGGTGGAFISGAYGREKGITIYPVPMLFYVSNFDSFDQWARFFQKVDEVTYSIPTTLPRYHIEAIHARRRDFRDWLAEFFQIPAKAK